MKHPSSNGCLFVQHSLTYKGMMRCQKSVILLVKLRFFCRKVTVLTMRGLDTLSDALQTILMHLGEFVKHSSSNGRLSVQHIVIFCGMMWCEKFGDFAWIFIVFMAAKTPCWPWGDQIQCPRLFKTFYNIHGWLWNTHAAMGAFFLDTWSHFPGWYDAPNWSFCLKLESLLWAEKTLCWPWGDQIQ